MTPGWLKKSHLPPDCIGVISQWMFQIYHKKCTFCTVVWWQEQCTQAWSTVPVSFMMTEYLVACWAYCCLKYQYV